ncbi:MAG: enoyl-CoA hydratase-related protein, partial [Myxococcota bacterium]
MPGQIRVTRSGPLAEIIFDHPERRNAMTADMWRALPKIAQELDADESVRAVVLRGEGELAFISGADISQFEKQRSGEDASQYEIQNTQAYQAISSIGKPVIASIHGFCIGGGCAIALMADLRFCSE